MSASRRALLDPHGDNVPPPGYLVVSDPVGLLKHILGDEALFVQGEDLCGWADDFGVGRNWQTTWLQSPATELHQLCPDLSADEGHSVINKLADRLGDLRRPLQLDEVTEAFWGASALWADEPGIDHAFRWLIWLAQAPADGSKMKLLWAKERNWQFSALPSLQRAYMAQSGTDAWRLLKEWLGVTRSQESWPTPPDHSLEGDLLRRLREDMSREAVDTDTDCFATLLDRAPGKSLLHIAAEECAKVLLANPRKATAERVRRLAKYVPYELEQKLRSLVPPERPGLPQWEFQAIKEWFTGKYLPYREWASHSGLKSDQPDWASANAEEFACQYLQFYAGARVGAKGAEHLAWVKSQRLTASENSVHLLVVLDGLAYPDAIRLRSTVEQESRRLFLDEETVALGPLPTVTEFAKPSVAKGLLPIEASQDSARLICTSVDAVVRALSNAVPGDVLVWTFQEPDRAYHFRADAGTANVRLEVDGQLSSLAKHIVSVAEKAPVHLRLRLIMTTDHGRLLTPAERRLTIPQGMTAHGRAAWGKSDVKYDGKGWLIDNGLAYLHPARFGLPEGQAYAVIISDHAFLMADGKGGDEPFPHGGLFPEEVLIPWFEFTRDRELVKIEATLGGKSEDGKPGKAALAVKNLGPASITVVGLAIDKLGMQIGLQEQVRTLDKKHIDVLLPKWPSRQDIQSLTACVTYLLPDGQPIKYEFPTEIKVESLYDRRDILGDLGGL